jgi:hypothetical protein
MRSTKIIAAVTSVAGVVLLAMPATAQIARPTYQVRFVGPAPGGMRVDYQVDREGRFSQRPLVTPARLDFSQPAVYRLKLTHIPGHEGLTLYPTLEIAAATPRSEAFLAHSAIAVEFTERDISQAVAGKYVTRVIHLPEADREFAPGGAARRGATLAIVRLGNRQLDEP